ncbi:MAG: hypothetical protein IJ191_02330 [Treponema sp.]|nr:hypothetical protein [Treponema sp.]
MIFDYSDGDFIMPMNGNLGMDSGSNLHMRMGDNCSMDMESGDLHFTSPWKRTDNTNDSSVFNRHNGFDTDLSASDSDDDFLGLGNLFGRLW